MHSNAAWVKDNKFVWRFYCRLFKTTSVHALEHIHTRLKKVLKECFKQRCFFFFLKKKKKHSKPNDKKTTRIWYTAKCHVNRQTKKDRFSELTSLIKNAKKRLFWTKSLWIWHAINYKLTRKFADNIVN